ncbi:MAG: Ig-like domain-containing protein [Lysobacterales bacterium]
MTMARISLIKVISRTAAVCALVWTVNPASSSELVIDEGVVVKFGPGANLVVKDRLQAQQGTVFTSLNDPDAGGSTSVNLPAPGPGDWGGISILPGAYADDVDLDRAEIRFAGSNGSAGLRFGRLPFHFSFLTIADSTIGIAAEEGSQALLTEVHLLRNNIGMVVDGHARPTITLSEIAGNNVGVHNLTPQTIVPATENWWGDASGPNDPVANPGGLGDPVSEGVDYGQYLPFIPLIDCGVRATDGQYNIIRRVVELTLRCRNATEYRLAETIDFGAIPYTPLSSPVGFQLSPEPGVKQIYAEYRGPQGQTRVVSLPQPFIYSPTSPVVGFIAPASGSILTGDTLIEVTATDPIGISEVAFYYGSQLIGTDAEPPYSVLWDVSAVPDGIYELSATATNSEGRTGSSSRSISLRRLSPQADAYVMDEGQVLFIDAPGVLANDNIVSTIGLQVQVVAQPNWGSLQMANDGSFRFEPDSPDRNGMTSFRYRLLANGLVSPEVGVSITVRPVNDPPSPRADSFMTDENVQIEVEAPGVLDNDTDVDSLELHAELVDQPTHGSVQLAANGSFTYVPEVNFRGVDSFEYRAVDTDGGATPATVTVTVTQPPTATNDVYLVDVDTLLAVVDPDEGLLANDHDAPENDPLTAELSRAPNHGELVLQADGTLEYLPDTGFVGLDTFSYQVTDGRSLSNVATVTLAVGITSLPRAIPDSYTMYEDQELVVSAQDGVLANDQDADTPRELLRPTVTYIPESGIQPGTVVMGPDGSFRVRPRPNYFGETFFLYRIYDGTSVSNEALVRLNVEPVNDGVEAVDDAFGVLRNTVLQIGAYSSIAANDHYDPDFEVNFEVFGPPQFGTLQLNSQTGALTYTPLQDFSGIDTFVYRVFQVATGISDTATVTFRTNGPPVAGPDAYTIDEDTVVEVSPGLLVNDSDPDGDPISLTNTSFGVGDYSVAVFVDNRQNPTRTTALAQYNYYGTRLINYAITDGLAVGRGKITLTVRPVPDNPIAGADSYLTQQNTPLTISAAALGVLANDYDPDYRAGPYGHIYPDATGPDLIPIIPELVTSTAHGTLMFSPDGTFSYAPDSGYSGTDTFQYRVLDGTGRHSLPATVSIRVNTPPVAVDDAYVSNEDVVLVVLPADGLLANDVDIDGDALHVEFESTPGGCGPCHGRLVLQRDGGFRYTPDANYFGTDAFNYRVIDNVAGVVIGHVSLTILPVNDAPVTEPDTYRTDEDVVLIAPDTLGLLRNDEEVDGEALTNASLVVPTQHGAVTVSGTGGFSYTPDADFNGRDTFRYRVYDESNLYTDEDVEILVTPVNDAPVALDDSYSVDKDQSLAVTAAIGVLANDTDVDGPALSAALVGPPAHGLMSLASDGSFSYQPDGVFVGIDQFQYQVDDGLGEVDVGVVTITVRDVNSPVEITVADDFYSFAGPDLLEAAPGVLANDSVSGAPSLTAALVVGPQVGSVALNADGSFHYLGQPGFSGVVTFTYSANAGGSAELGLVTLDIQSTANVPPVAVGEQFGVIEDTLLDSRSSGGLLANDSDFEGAPLSLQLLTQPQHGTLDAHADGQFTYQPASNFAGADQFTYTVSDGQLSSNVATAAITVFAQNDAPTAVNDVYQTVRDQVLVVDPALGLLANDSDVDGDALVVELVDAPVYGQATVAADGGFSYQPQPGYVGAVSFRYAASDGAARTIATVSISVVPPGNQAPVAQGETLVIDEDQLLQSAHVGALTDNDSDPDGDSLSVVLADPPAHGALTLDGGDFTYRPSLNFFGADGFSYRVTDGALSSNLVVASITVQPVNDPPLAAADTYQVLQAQTLTVPANSGVLANDADVEGEALSATLESPPGHGVVNLAADGGFVYLPNASFHGRDEFAYRASDGIDSSVGRAVIDVTQGPNQRPVAIGEVFAIPEDSVLDTRTLDSLLANDVDPDGQALTLVILSQPASGQLEGLGAGHIRYTPARDVTGSIRFDYAVSDGELESLPVQVEILLLPVNDPPQAQADVYVLAPGISPLMLDASAGVLANDHDPDGDTLLVTLIQAPNTGTLNLSLDGGLIYTPVEPRPPSDSFVYRITDPAGLSAEAPVQILLNGQPSGDQLFQSGFESAP